ncbi:MAG TPA: hypothetical protein VI755_12580 [Anaerolineales bacterium]|nr:hypothetical protein [Anaerolineales bacterium]
MGDTFLILDQPCDEAIAWLTRQANSIGLQVMRTFDLQVARQAHTECPCPHHGTDQCDCQMVILLVYAEGLQPSSLEVHSHDGKSWFSLVDTPQQRADPRLEASIQRVLISKGVSP